MAIPFWRPKASPKCALSEVLGDAPLPTFPSLVFEVLGDLRNPDIPSRQIASRLQADPSLSIRVLKMANSAAYGARRSIDDVNHAVVFLGRRSVEALVLAVAVRDALPLAPAPGFDSSRFWRAAARRAASAQGFANVLHPRTAGMSFTAGLLQDMAVPLLAHRRGEEYGRILHHWHGTSGDLSAIEVQEFGWTHADVAGWLCQEWDIPQTLADAIAEHHDLTASAERVPPAIRLVSAMGEEADDLGPIIALAEDEYQVPADRVQGILEDAYERADDLASLLAA